MVERSQIAYSCNSLWLLSFIFQFSIELYHISPISELTSIFHVGMLRLQCPFLSTIFTPFLFSPTPHSPQEVCDVSYTNVPFLDTDKQNKATWVPMSLHNIAPTENPKMPWIHTALYQGSFQGPNHLRASSDYKVCRTTFHKVTKVTAWLFITSVYPY